jgi:hypothetical protein
VGEYYRWGALIDEKDPKCCYSFSAYVPAAVMIPTRPSRSANMQRQKVSAAALIMRAVARPYQTGSDEAA